MINQIRSEWVKIRSVRSTLVMCAAAIVLCVGVAAIVAIQTKSGDVANVDGALAGLQLASVLFLVLGVQVIGQEYRFQTIRPTFSTVASRQRVLAAKAITLSVVVAVTTVILAVGSVLASKAISSSRDIVFDMSADGTWRVLGGSVAAAVLSALFGFGIGVIVRQPIAGIMIAIIWSLIGEVLISSFVKGSQKWLPISSGSNMRVLETDSGFLTAPAAGLYGLVLMSIICVIGATRIARSDA
jgi:ABC-2 type transport system permease protein